MILGFTDIILFEVFLKKLYGPFLWIWFNCLKAEESLQGVCLLLTTKSPGIPSGHLIDLGMMKD